MNTEVVLCSKDNDFAGRLIGFLRRQNDRDFCLSYYSNVDDLIKGKSYYDHLLIDEALYEELRYKGEKKFITENVLVICEKKKESYPKGYIYKYSSAKNFLYELSRESGISEPDNGNGGAMALDRKIRLKEEILPALSRLKEDSQAEVYEVIETAIHNENRNHPMEQAEQEWLKKELYYSICGYDVLQELMDDEDVTEIMVNGYDRIFMEKGGRLYQSSRFFESKERLTDIINKIVAEANRSVNLASPIVDARLADGSRVNVVLDPVAINGPIMTIRRFGDKPIGENELIEYGSITKECLSFLSMCVRAGYNILISGGTGAGKTTFLNVMSSFIPEDERIITIEDSAELKLKGINNLVRFEARMETADGVRPITIRELIKTAL